MKNGEKKFLPREWIAIFSLIVLIFVMLFHAMRQKSVHEEKIISIKNKNNQTMVEVTVIGSVLEPGMYVYNKGISVREVILKANPEDGVNLTDEKFDRPIKPSEKIKVSLKKEGKNEKKKRKG